MLDLFCGRFGWGKAFAARGWEVVGIDLVAPPEVPAGCTFIQADILGVDFVGYMGFRCARSGRLGNFDFICASSPCEQFSVHGMKHFHPNPPYPELGINLFNHTRSVCEASGVPYVMENVRAAQTFVGMASNHVGPFYLWGSAVPPILPQGIRKGMDTSGVLSAQGRSRDEIREYMKSNRLTGAFNSKSKERKEITAINATIPQEIASCVCDYAERLIEQKASA